MFFFPTTRSHKRPTRNLSSLPLVRPISAAICLALAVYFLLPFGLSDLSALPVASPRTYSPIRPLALSPDQQYLASTAFGAQISLWDVESGEHRRNLRGHTSLPVSAAFSPDARWLATGDNIGTVRLWHLATPSSSQPLSLPQSNTAPVDPSVAVLAFSLDGQRLATGLRSGDIHIWSLDPSGRVAHEHHLTTTDFPLSHAAFSPDRQLLVSATIGQGAIEIWDVETGEKRERLLGEDQRASAVIFVSEDHVAWGNVYGDAYSWTFSSGEFREPLPTRGSAAAVTSAALSPDGSFLAMGSGNGTIHVWDITSEDSPTLIPVSDASLAYNPREPITTLAFRPDDAALSAISARHLRQLHLTTQLAPRLQPILFDHQPPFAAHATQSSIATIHPGVVNVWDANSVGLLGGFYDANINPETCMTLARDGALVIAAQENNTASARDVRTGRRIFSDPRLFPFHPCTTRSSGRVVPRLNDDQVALYDRWTGRTARVMIPTAALYDTILLSSGTVWDAILQRYTVILGDSRAITFAVLRPAVPLAQLSFWLVTLLLGLATARFGITLRRRVADRRRWQQDEVALVQVERFLTDANATTRRTSVRTALVTRHPTRLGSFTPFPVVVAGSSFTESAIADLKGREHARIGLLLYRDPPDSMARLRMAEVRLRDRFTVIPIPIVEVEQALANGTCAALLSTYCDRYLPGADLFDDRVAVSDVMTFYGRSELLSRLSDELANRHSIGLFGLRKSGKTSVLKQLSFALRDYPVVECDLQVLGERTRFAGDLFDHIVRTLCDLIAKRRPGLFPAAGLPPFAAPMTAVGFERYFLACAGALQEAGYNLPVVCLFDEMERVLPREGRYEAGEFNLCFGVLRALSQGSGVLAMVVADVHPDCNRINHWPTGRGPSNPVYGFFKEIFLEPFGEASTMAMLADLGGFMARQFDDETLRMIQQGSGGHPFVARQLASLVCSRIPAEDNSMVSWRQAEPYIREPLRYSAVLRNYCEESIWGDLEVHGYYTAMEALRILGHEGTAVGEKALKATFGNVEGGMPASDALLWLESVGLVSRRMEDDSGYVYRLRLQVLAGWLSSNAAG